MRLSIFCLFKTWKYCGLPSNFFGCLMVWSITPVISTRHRNARHKNTSMSMYGHSHARASSRNLGSGFGGESASSGYLRVSLFTVECLPKVFAGKADPSRKWWCWPWIVGGVHPSPLLTCIKVYTIFLRFLFFVFSFGWLICTFWLYQSWDRRF